MTARDRHHDRASFRIRSPLQAAVILLGIYVTLSLAMAGLIYVLTVREAAVAIMPPGTVTIEPAPTKSAAISSPARQSSGSPSSSLRAQAAEWAIPSRACEPHAHDGSSCVYD